MKTAALVHDGAKAGALVEHVSTLACARGPDDVLGRTTQPSSQTATLLVPSKECLRIETPCTTEIECFAVEEEHVGSPQPEMGVVGGMNHDIGSHCLQFFH